MRVADSHAHSCDLDHPGTPSSSLAVLREQDQRVEYLLLFDSVIILDGPSGLAVVTDRRGGMVKSCGSPVGDGYAATS